MEENVWDQIFAPVLLAGVGNGVTHVSKAKIMTLRVKACLPEGIQQNLRQRQYLCFHSFSFISADTFLL